MSLTLIFLLTVGVIMYKLLPRVTVIVFFFVTAFLTYGQAGSGLHGTVTDNKGEALPGIVVQVVGKQIGTTTNLDGKYELPLSPGKYEIKYYSVGYHPQKKNVLIVAGEKLLSNVSLSEDLIGTDEVVVLGTRANERSVTDSPVPVDVIGAEEIKASGFSQTTQVLKMLVPSYNAPQPSIADGSDHVRPATLRGLGPDQVLVLVNGKRRHTSALVHVNGTIGRGSTGVDLNAIPVSAIERIEVLRDGASAQYGSDAIAGVINIILKKSEGFDASASYGQYLSSEDRGYTTDEGNRPVETTNFASGTYNGLRWDSSKTAVSHTDGKTVNLHLGYGLPIGDGVVYVSGQISSMEPTNRSGIDPRPQYSSAVPGNENTFDPLGQGFRINHKYGDSKLNDGAIFINGSLPLSNGMSIYAFGGYSHRFGLSAGFYRRANDSRNVPAIYPNGFLPHIETGVNDFSLSAGVKGFLSGWSYDLSETYGMNSLQYRVVNSVNTSMWTKSPTDFDAGTLKFGQATTNLDFFKSVDVGREFPLNVAAGAEFRWENYKIIAGELASYLRGDSTSKATGSQVFPGFSPTNAQNASRTNFGLYVDLEHNVTQLWLVSAAARFENYSDFGTTITEKFATKYNIAYGLAARGAVSTGFRAPSLAQSYFSAVSTNFISGIPYDIGTFPVNTSVAKALGATDLKAEKSVNLSFGLTYDIDNLSVTVDVYQITIKDRIVFTENFTGTAIANYLNSLGIFNAGGGRYFTNAVNTKTKGLDITARYGINLADLGTLRLTAALNFTKTEITNKDAIKTPAILKTVTTTNLFDRIEQGRFEVGQPRSTYNFMANYMLKEFGAMMRWVRYGAVTSYQSNTDLTLDQTYSAKWIADAEVSYKLMKNYEFAIGSNNVFDVYPDKVLKVNSTNGILPYSGLSPFGFNGRFVYFRASVKI